jgi:hypothetical protein
MRAFFLLLVIVSALAGASYAGARLIAGRVIGPEPNAFGSATTHFAFSGITALKGKPRGWIVAYPQARGLSPTGAEVYVSPTGRLLGTRPGNLAQRVEAQRAEEP